MDPTRRRKQSTIDHLGDRNNVKQRLLKKKKKRGDEENKAWIGSEQH